MTALPVYLVLLSATLASPTFPTHGSFNLPAICSSFCLDDYPNLSPRVDTPPVLDTCPPVDPSAVPGGSYRSTIEIVWSCLTIIFASTWVCVHPNVTGYNTTTRQRLQRRTKLFALAIFAPELLAVFAWFQWRGCRQLHKRLRGKALELGIPLQLNQGTDELKLPMGDVTPLAGAEGEGGDVLPLLSQEDQKVYPRKLPTTFLGFSFYEADPTETAWTLTHAHFVQMGGIVFKDPTNGNVGFKEPALYGENRWTDDEIRAVFAVKLSEEAILDKSKGSALAKVIVVIQVLWFVTQTVARATQRLPITHLEVVCLAFTLFNVGMYACWWDKPLDVEHPFEVPGEPDTIHRSGKTEWLNALLGALDALPVGHWGYSPEKRLYPSLWCYSEDTTSPLDDYFSNWDLGFAFTFALSFTSISFGAMHLVGWFLPSPSFAETVIWRVSCLVLTFYPLLNLIIAPLANGVSISLPDALGVPLFGICVVLSLAGAVAYVLARFLLLILPFIELRSLPPLSHQTVSWANFLPHI